MCSVCLIHLLFVIHLLFEEGHFPRVYIQQVAWNTPVSGVGRGTRLNTMHTELGNIVHEKFYVLFKIIS